MHQGSARVKKIEERFSPVGDVEGKVPDQSSEAVERPLGDLTDALLLAGSDAPVGSGNEAVLAILKAMFSLDS